MTNTANEYPNFPMPTRPSPYGPEDGDMPYPHYDYNYNHNEPMLMTGDIEVDTRNMVDRAQRDPQNIWFRPATNEPECTDEDYLAAQRETQEQSASLSSFRVNLNNLTSRIRNLRWDVPPVYGPAEPPLPRTYGPDQWISTASGYGTKVVFNPIYGDTSTANYFWKDSEGMYRPFGQTEYIDHRQRALRIRRTQRDLDLEDEADRTHYQNILDNCQRHTLEQGQYRTRFAYVAMENAFACLRDRIQSNNFNILQYTQEHMKYLKDNTRFIFAWRSDVSESVNVSMAKQEFTEQLTRMYHGYFSLVLVVRMQRQQGHRNFCLPLNIKEIFADGLESYYAAWESLRSIYPKYTWEKFDLLSRYASY